jgi:N utilization substance protein B
VKPARKYDRSSAARSVSRKLAVQALYRWQLNASPWQDLVQEFANDPDMPKADRGYFGDIIAGVGTELEALDAVLAGSTDRPPPELDPVEHAALLIGTWELRSRPDVPYRVAISEAVALTRKFGATDGYKFVNAVLDRLARELRPDQY